MASIGHDHEFLGDDADGIPGPEPDELLAEETTAPGAGRAGAGTRGHDGPADPGADAYADGEALEAGSLISAAPGLARLAAVAWWRTAGWTAQSSLRAGVRVLDAARSGEPPSELLAQAGQEAREYGRRLLGLAEAMEAAVAGNGWGGGDTDRPFGGEGDAGRGGSGRGRNGSGRARNGSSANGNGVPSREVLRERGEELLRRSADVEYTEEAHPAYERILGELAPDDARILRFLFQEGPQPAVDVRTSKTFGVTSEMVAPGLSMIGEQAGCRYLDRVPAYLNNLYRLGLIWFSHEALTDPLRYQVLEAQPKVSEAMEGAGRSKTVRRSIFLTPFGEDFCEVCLPTDTGEFEALTGIEPRDDIPNVSRHPV